MTKNPKKNRIPKKTANRIRNKSGINLPVGEGIKNIRGMERKWCFSFQYWDQRKYFGLGEVRKEWFADLLRILKDLSLKYVEEIVKDSRAKQVFRFHTINWEKCSITKEEFNSYIPKEYRSKETDIVQFQIAKSKGRVVGFLDAESVFQIVLLDPAHNMQLSQHNDYKKVKTSILGV